MQTNRQHSTKAERQAHIDAWQQSQLSQQNYCKQTGINYYTFNSWITKQKLKPTQASTFLKVEAAPEPDSPTENFATLTFSNQLTLELHQEVSAQFLKQLITCK